MLFRERGRLGLGGGGGGVFMRLEKGVVVLSEGFNLGFRWEVMWRRKKSE